MESNRPKTLEELIHRELSKLPERQAPKTLAPRVLALIQAQSQRHWWQLPWINWPLAFQIASLPVLLLGAAGFMFAVEMLWGLVPSGPATGPAMEHILSLALLWDLLGTLGNALLVLARSTGPLLLIAAVSIPLAMYLACVGLGTVCYRLALSKC
jgi:hypothetical protein